MTDQENRTVRFEVRVRPEQLESYSRAWHESPYDSLSSWMRAVMDAAARHVKVEK